MLTSFEKDDRTLTHSEQKIAYTIIFYGLISSL